MKQFVLKITSVLLVFLILFSTLSLVSCNLDTDENNNTEDNGDSNEIIQNTTNNEITITADNTNSVTYATALGLRSAVSIYCTFESTSGGTSPWNPKPTTQTYYTTGSGVIYQIDESGSAFIVTNHHVVYDSSSDTDNGISDYHTYYDLNTGLLVRAEEISVYEITEGGLGEEILKEGDVVKSITIGDETITVTRQHHLIDAMLDVRVGDTVSLLIIRDGVETTVNAVITEDSLSAQ